MKAISWLAPKENEDFFGSKNIENKKISGLLVLKEYCLYSPIISYNKLFVERDSNGKVGEELNYNKILNLMVDQKQQIKELSYFCLKSALCILSSREKNNEIMSRIYD